MALLFNQRPGQPFRAVDEIATVASTDAKCFCTFFAGNNPGDPVIFNFQRDAATAAAIRTG